MTSGSSKVRDTPPPSIIAGRYHVERLLGRGGMATVYLCSDSETGTKVAVKVLRGELGSAVIVERFLREIEFASELDHPRVPKVLDSGVTGELPFYVMTYIEGESLRERLDRLKQLPVDEAVSITAAVIEPMTYAHRLGIIHRDIKPGNILVGVDGVYVLDFGIARAILASADERLTSTGVALGTPAYMSPEQALADHDLDARSDIYSLACVTYEMIAGIPPFVGATPQAVMARRFASPPPPLRETREAVPEHVDRAVARALSRAPADRWQTAREFSDALTSPSTSGTLGNISEKVRSRRSLYGRGIAATLGLAVLVAGTFAFNAVRGDDVARAQRAIASWDLSGAEVLLANAASSNRDDARVQMWLAQTMMLNQRPTSEWSPLIARASDGRPGMDSADMLRLDALASYARKEFPVACSRFSQLAARVRISDRRDFTPQLALADCLLADSGIVAHALSPSGFVFRSSFHNIESLYQELLERHIDRSGAFAVIAPRLQRVLAVDRRLMRRGVVSQSGQPMYAQPQLLADTLAYVPVSISTGGATVRFGDARALEAAVVRNQTELREVAVRWTSTSRGDVASREMLARVLELAGELEGSENSALGQLTIARSMAASVEPHTPDSFAQLVRLGDAHVRVWIRLGRFDRAGILTDTVLALREPMVLTGARKWEVTDVRWRLSSLRGRVDSVIALERAYASDLKAYTSRGPEALPRQVAEEAIVLSNYAAFAMPADSINASVVRLNERIDALIAPGKSLEVRKALLVRPLTIAAPVIGPHALESLGNARDPLPRAIIAFARKDYPATRAGLEGLALLHSDDAPGAISMDATYLEAWLWNELGNAAAAGRLLDNALRGIPKAQPSILGSPVLIASMVRSMLLRADIADRLGEAGIARKWNVAAVQLWGQRNPQANAQPETR